MMKKLNRNSILYIKSIIRVIIYIVPFTFAGCKTNVAILYNSNDIDKSLNAESFVKSIRHTLSGDSMLITNKDKTKKAVSCDSIWGIMYKDRTLYRYYKDQYYFLRQNSSIQIYSQTNAGYKSSSTSYYFSKSINSEIYSLRWKNIRKQFQNDTCFLRRLDQELKWYQDYSSFDKRNKTYRIVQFYNECKK